MAKKFKQRFTQFACDGDKITATFGKYTVTARIVPDDIHGPPWKEHDGHGPVSEWECRQKRPGEVVLSTSHNSHRYYDVQAAMEIAKRDGWDAPPYGEGTAGERAARAVRADYDYLKAWCDDEWHWVGVLMAVSYNGVELDDAAASLWGIESTAHEHLSEVADELIEEALKVGRDCRKAMVAKLK